MAEQTINTPALAPPLLGLPLGEARRMAKKRSQAKVEFKLVESEAKALTVVRQFPEAGDELNTGSGDTGHSANKLDWSEASGFRRRALAQDR